MGTRNRTHQQRSAFPLRARRVENAATDKTLDNRRAEVVVQLKTVYRQIAGNSKILRN